MAAFHQPAILNSGKYVRQQENQMYQKLNFSGDAFPLLFDGDVKLAMQNLNERLVVYRENVRSLENANAKLELKIKEWNEKRSPAAGSNCSGYFKVTEELQTKLQQAQIENARIALELDNCKLIAEHFRLKYNNEQSMRFGTENDIQALRHMRDNLTVTTSNLKLDIEGLQEDLIYLKKNHEEVMDELRKKVVNTVNVEVDAAPGPDIVKLLTDMRLQYEELVSKKQQEVKEWFEKQTEKLNIEVAVDMEQLNTNKTMITKLTQTIRDLEITLQNELNMKAAFETSLSDVKLQYDLQLKDIHNKIESVNAQWIKKQSKMKDQSHIHDELAKEIENYRSVLEAWEFQSQALDLEEETTGVDPGSDVRESADADTGSNLVLGKKKRTKQKIEDKDD